jgi:dipeptidyl aminopeptidase/acylaminoacyl peptidase
MYVDPAGTIFARARVAPDADITSLVSMKIADDKASLSTLLSIAGFDFNGRLIRNRAGFVIGVNYLSEALGQHWYDKRLQDIQAKVDALLPATNNLLDCGQCDQLKSILVTSSSDRQPVVYRLFDPATGQLETLANSRPWIDARQMAKADMVRIPTRDGMSMPVHITMPIGPKATAPMVVLVHGGPWERGSLWAWDPEPQFLASRGYVVVEPEFRGSRGFGSKWYRGGFKQWGLAMQDDVADAALWAIKEGYADPKRVCIAGASYGGYATLMGLARNPEIFRCGVEWAGVTDIDLMYSIQWSDSDDNYKQFGMPVLIGDRQKDAAQLAATSPLRLADKIRQPLFMAYGGIDERVPIKHGVEFRDAVTKSNPNVEWKVYAEEGHGWALPANNIDFWTRVEKFLDKNLKNAP